MVEERARACMVDEREQENGTSPSPGIALQWPCTCSHSSLRRGRSGTGEGPGARVEVEGERRCVRYAHMKEGKCPLPCRLYKVRKPLIHSNTTGWRAEKRGQEGSGKWP